MTVEILWKQQRAYDEDLDHQDMMFRSRKMKHAKNNKINTCNYVRMYEQ